jgi:Fur family peroxide stress response transcriptional regulator
MQTDIVETIIQRFSDHDIRLTPQRIGVYRYLLENRIHPTVENVYLALKNQNPSLSKTTIYNTVEALTKAGLIRVVRVKEGDARLDEHTDQHGHFLCCECNSIYDFNLDGCRYPDSLHDFYIDSIDVIASGICNKCKKQE